MTKDGLTVTRSLTTRTSGDGLMMNHWQRSDCRNPSKYIGNPPSKGSGDQNFRQIGFLPYVIELKITRCHASDQD